MLKRQRGGAGLLLEIIIVLVIVLLLARKGIETYTKPLPRPQVKEAAEEAKVNAASYPEVINSTKERVQDIMDTRQKDLDSAMDNASKW